MASSMLNMSCSISESSSSILSLSAMVLAFLYSPLSLSLLVLSLLSVAVCWIASVVTSFTEIFL